MLTPPRVTPSLTITTSSRKKTSSGMKDKACSDFVFMPLKPDQRVPPVNPGGATVAPAEGLNPAPAMVDTGGGGTEVKSKIVVVGDCQCGKTTLIHRYVHSRFQEVRLKSSYVYEKKKLKKDKILSKITVYL